MLNAYSVYALKFQVLMYPEKKNGRFTVLTIIENVAIQLNNDVMYLKTLKRLLKLTGA